MGLELPGDAEAAWEVVDRAPLAIGRHRRICSPHGDMAFRRLAERGAANLRYGADLPGVLADAYAGRLCCSGPDPDHHQILWRLFLALIKWLDKVFPLRLAVLLSGIGLLLTIWGGWSGVLVNSFFAVANQVFAPRDASTAEGITQPASELRSGSPASLVAWETLGEKGRTFVATGPSVDELNAFHGHGAMEPIRVYVGLKSADTPEARAQLVLDELIRTDAFDREVLVVASTTGTGFLEPNAMTALEYVHNGNVAVAGAQYSYLPSWISLLADQDEVTETSQEVFATIHAYMSTLPEDERPEIYLYGLIARCLRSRSDSDVDQHRERTNRRCSHGRSSVRK